jgi:hypothetical protein
MSITRSVTSNKTELDLSKLNITRLSLGDLSPGQRTFNETIGKKLILGKSYQFGKEVYVNVLPVGDHHINGVATMTFSEGIYGGVREGRLFFTGFPVGAPVNDESWAYHFAVSVENELTIQPAKGEIVIAKIPAAGESSNEKKGFNKREERKNNRKTPDRSYVTKKGK